ncbi:MAG TPA: hypothetical protein VJZ27_10010, partial [Aggregatilineales bacterium]|nr:hypothetical protein [Aggregatilineales bacterium]
MVLPPIDAHSESTLTETYTSQDGTLTLHYPAEWSVREDHEQIFLATRPELNRFNAPPLEAGDRRLLVTPVAMADLGIGESVSVVDAL